MIKKISLYLLLPMLLLATILAVNGIHKIELDQTYYNFIREVNIRLSYWSVKIPDIPKIPTLKGSGGVLVLNVLINFFNGLISIINVITMILNVLIECLQFVLTFLEYVVEFAAKVVSGYNPNGDSHIYVPPIVSIV